MSWRLGNLVRTEYGDRGTLWPGVLLLFSGITVLGSAGYYLHRLSTPIMYGIMGFLFGLVYGLIINFVLRLSGGLEFETREA